MSIKTKNWFEVSKEGLKQLLNGRSRTFAIAELLQNAWDQDITEVNVEIEKDAKSRAYRVSVTDDDPNGWQDIADAFTLFKPSNKKADPTKRGRFNLGEKLVLAVCKEAKIVSVNHAVCFNKNGRRLLKERVPKGSTFTGLLSLNKGEIKKFEDYVQTLLVPSNIDTYVKILGEEFMLEPHDLIHEFDIQLPTVISDADGNMKRTTRQTVVQLFDPFPEETPSIYEMGIPVVGLDSGKWHINVQQKIPLNMNRDNVTPAYLSQLQVSVLNETVDLLDDEDVTEDWVTQASGDERCDDEAVESVLTSRYGEDRVSYDPSDPEANMIAVSKGYTLVHGGSMSSGMWKNAKSSGSIRPSGQVTPSANAYSESGDPVDVVAESKWTPNQRCFVEYAKKLHQDLGLGSLEVLLVKVSNFEGAYSSNSLHINVNLGNSWFRESNFEKQVSLLLHEFAHYYESNHLSDGFHQAICNLGAKLAMQLGAKRR